MVAYGQLFHSLADRQQLPALFHCVTGKDRTGWAAAALLTLLGVPRPAVVRDYLRSNDLALSRYRRDIEAFVGAGGDDAITGAIFGVRPEYLDAAFDEVEKRHHTIERYFSEALGLGAGRQEALRDVFLE